MQNQCNVQCLSMLLKGVKRGGPGEVATVLCSDNDDPNWYVRVCANVFVCACGYDAV